MDRVTFSISLIKFILQLVAPYPRDPTPYTKMIECYQSFRAAGGWLPFDDLSHSQALKILGFYRAVYDPRAERILVEKNRLQIDSYCYPMLKV